MHKIWVILKREYLTRVKNKAFIIMTFLGPLLMVLVYGGSLYLATRDFDSQKQKMVVLKDPQNHIKNSLPAYGSYQFVISDEPQEELIDKVAKGKYDALLNIKDKETHRIDSIEWYSKKSLSLEQTSSLKEHIADKLYQQKLLAAGVKQSSLDSLKPLVEITSLEIDESGKIEVSQTGIKSAIGFILAVIIYMFIFIYGSLVLRGVLEEKTNRIVEVIVSSVKPFQLMMGKILGIAMVGLTQFLAWVGLTAILMTVVTSLMAEKTFDKNKIQGMTQKTEQTVEAFQHSSEESVSEVIKTVPIAKIIITFILFFLGGYLLYSSMFAAIGAAINQDTDAQQFMLPVSIPLIVAFIIAQTQVFKDPNGILMQIFSYIPFTSPVVMVVRSGFTLEWWEIGVSFTLLLLTFILFVWLTGRIYRVGILMYGKKPSWKDLGKWIFVK